MKRFNQYYPRDTYTFQKGDSFSACCGSFYCGSTANGGSLGNVRKGIMLLEGLEEKANTKHWNTYHVQTKNGPITLRLKDA